jgi:hypothetical protein
MSQPHVGDVVEKFAELWASQAGFTVTTVQRDRRGWDCLCEFAAPRAPSDSDPLGQETVDFCAKLQVKGTRSTKRAVRVRLSNMFRAVDDVLPWFFLIVRVDSTAERPLEVALVHIGPTIVETVLKRVYQLPRTARASLHRHSFDLKWTSRELVPAPYAASIRQIVYDLVGSNPHSYARSKRDWYLSAGKAGTEMRATFQIRGATEDELYRRLSRAAIGLDEALAISELAATTTRFGITEPSEKLSSREGALLQIQPTPSELKSELVVSRPDGTGAISLKCSVRSAAAVFPQLPKEYWLLRFQTRLLDLVFGEVQNHFNARLVVPPDDQAIALSELAPAFALLDFLGCSIGTPLQLRLLRAGKDLPLGQIVLQEELPSELAKFTRAACTVVELARHLGADLGSSVSLSRVYDCGSLAEFMLAAKAQRPIQVLIETRIKANKLDLSKPAAVVTNPTIQVGSVLYGVIVVVPGPIELLARTADDLHIRVLGSSPRSLESVRLATSHAATYSWDPCFKRAVAELESEGFENVITAPFHMT